MPKSTIVTFSAAGTAASDLSSVRSLGRNKWTSLGRRLYSQLAPSFKRENWLINILAFLLSRISLAGELAPFGLAFFAAVAQADRLRAPGAAVFVAAGLLSAGRNAEAGLYLFAILLFFRLTANLTAAERKLWAIPLFVFAAVAIGAAPLVLWPQATLYSLLLVLFDAVMCLVLAYVFISGIKLLIAPAGERQATTETVLCTAILLALAIAGLGDAALLGYSLRNVAGSFIIMTLAMTGGGISTAVGVTVGLAVGLTDVGATAFISLYAVAGLLAGTFHLLGKIAVAAGFLLGVVITALHFGPSAEFVRLFIEAAIAALAFMAVPRRWILEWSNSLQAHPDRDKTVARSIQDTAAKLSGIAEIFGSLAAAGRQAGEASVKIKERSVAGLLSAVGEQVCGRCLRRSKCWETDYYHTYQGMIDALSQAERTELTVAALPKHLQDNCLSGRDLVETINKAVHNCAYRQSKIAAKRQVISEQLKAIGGIINNLAGSLFQETAVDGSLAVALKNKAAYINCPLDKVRVSLYKGATTVEATKAPCSGNRECVNTILPLTARVLQRKLALRSECGQNRADKKCRLTLQVTGSYTVQTGMASTAKEQGVCGDTSAVISFPQGKVALVVSDGMGSGNRAAGESAAAVEYLAKLLTAGFDAGLAVKTVNDILLLRGREESFATLDIAVIDTYAGETEFIKVGSAPCYIKRVREVETVKSAAPPVGILDQVEVEPIRWRLAAGDIIVMVSDGIIDVPSRSAVREPWLVNFLRRLPEGSAQEMADEILRQALELTGPNLRDDMTVMVARLVEL